LTISPKTLPDPLLRYRVNVFATEQETGNAYPLHLAALKELNRHQANARAECYRSEAYRNIDISDTEYEKERDRLLFKAFPLYSFWGNNAWTEISSDEEAQLYRRLREVYPLLEKASKKTYYDWSDQYKYEGIATLLPTIQESREIARYLESKANWEIRNGKYDDAIKTIRVGIANADHVLESQPPSFLVGMLVGLALKGMMYNQLLLLSAQPDAPNLYPALMQLTYSKKVWLNAIQSETKWLFSKYNDDTFWESLDDISSEQAQAVFDELMTTYFMGMSNLSDGKEMSAFRTAVCLISYQPAKNRLLQKGKSEQKIEALSTYQVVIPYALEEIKRTYDYMVFDASIPIGESHTAANFDEYVISKGRNPTNYPADMMLSMLAPATQAARKAFYRQQQTTDLLKIINAVRYYAAVHGKVPVSLDEITELAVPKICPITAKPYEYRVEGKTAIIDYEAGWGKSRMEITVE
jgi:hypothetical protein